MTPRRVIEPARLAGTTLLRTQSDARLVDLVRAGHAAAFEAIVQRYRRPLLSYCSRLLPASRAEDAVQQTFLRAYQAMTSGDADLNLRPWLYRIAHNASLNLLRQNGWSHEQLDENMDGVQRPEQAVELRERLRSTVRAVKALPERQRDAVLLREVEGLSYQEIALALGVGDGAVRQLLHRARATLRSGASALTPAGLVERLTSAITSGGDPVARAGELAAGAGGGLGAVKLGAAILATGVLATGAVTGVPLQHHALHSSAGAKEARAATRSSGEPSSSRGASGGVGNQPFGLRDRGRGGSGESHRDREGRGHGSGRSGRSGGGGDRRGSSSGGSSSPDGSGDRNRRGGSSGPGSRDRSGDGSHDGSGTSGSGTSGSGDGTSGGGGTSGSGDAASGSGGTSGSGSASGSGGSDDAAAGSQSGSGGGGQTLPGGGGDMSTTSTDG